MRRKILAILLVVSMILTLAFAAGCSKQEAADESAGGDKSYTLEVVSQDGSSRTYEATTAQEFLKGAMDELAEAQDFSYGEEGGFIVTINEERADYNEDNAYWAIYVNGEYGQYGADQQPVTDGDAYKFEYTPAD